MENREFSTPLDLKQIRVTDAFWHREQELVRTQVIPYQWESGREDPWDLLGSQPSSITKPQVQ